MMALLTLSFCKNDPGHDELDVARFMAYQVAQSLVPEAHLEQFNLRFKPNLESLSQRSSSLKQQDYYLSPSRREAYHWLDSLLVLREDRTTFTTETQKYGGLGGVILEGEPGIGKSELVTHILRTRRFIEVNDYKAPLKQSNSFYRMPVSMPLQEKEALLRKAFNEGAVVIIDEINSSPMMERLINALLMGQTPEGKRPERPGFFIIGTQNPSRMAGRREMSMALKRRTVKLHLEHYNSSEMEFILVKKGLAHSMAQNLVSAFVEQKSFAIKNQLTPVPNFRDLLRASKHCLKAYSDKPFLNMLKQIEKNHQRLVKKYDNNAKQQDVLFASRELIKELKTAQEHYLFSQNKELFYRDCKSALNKAKKPFNTHRSGSLMQWFNNLIDAFKELFHSTKQKAFIQNRAGFFENKGSTTRSADVLFKAYNDWRKVGHLS